MEYLHTQDLVHGDVKGSNILISDDEHALMTDFGLSKIMTTMQTSTAIRGSGTVRWQSPELWNDEPKSFPSDVWAFGMTIVEVSLAIH